MARSIVVEIYFGGTWVDVTQYVLANPPIRISRGRSDEQAEPQPGTCSLALLNTDGRFTPGNVSSPYYPYVRLRAPIRVQIHVANGRNLCADPSFELAAGWRAVGAAWDISQSTTRAWHGTYSTLVTWDSGSNGAAELICYGLDIGRQYTASLYVWVPAGSPAVRLQIVGGPTGPASTLTDTWQRITVTWTAAGPSALIRLIPATATTYGQEVWVDAIQVEEGAAPTAWDSNGAVLYPRYTGTVNDWPTEWLSPGLAVARITATDRLAQLGRVELRAMLVEEVLRTGPLAYYPLDEPSDSTSCGDLSGTTAGPLTIQQVGSGGTLEFAGADGPGPDAQRVPLFTPAAATAGKYLKADLGYDFETESSSQYILVECWVATSTAGRAILGVASTDSQYQLVLALDATGKLSVEWTQTGGTLTVSTTTSPNLADGVIHHVVYSEADQKVWVDGVAYTVSTGLMFRARQLSVGGYANNRLWSGSISHVALYAPGFASDLVTHYTVRDGHAGDTSGTRVGRLADYAGIPTGERALDTGLSTLTGQPTAGKSVLDAMREVAQTEQGMVFAGRDGKLVFHSRSRRYNPTVAFTLTAGDIAADSAFVDDDQLLVNEAIVQRHNGARVRVVDAPSQSAYGLYRLSVDSLAASDNQAVDMANWIVQRRATPQPRMPRVTVEAMRPSLSSLYGTLLDADISTVVGVTGLPSQAPASSQTLVVEGYTEEITAVSHRITWDTSPAYTDSVWVLGDPVYGVLGTTTRLAY